MWLLDFLFGKKPLLNFGKDGRASHNLSNEKWQAWKDRFGKNPEFDWRAHAGTKSGAKASSEPGAKVRTPSK